MKLIETHPQGVRIYINPQNKYKVCQEGVEVDSPMSIEAADLWEARFVCLDLVWIEDGYRY